MRLLKGKNIANKILSDISKEIKGKKLSPGLAVVLVGRDKASEVYVNLKEKAAEKVGINFFKFKFSDSVPEGKIIALIKELNEAENIHGIIVQLPLPGKFNAEKIINTIDLRKDVDGFLSQSKSEPVFPKAILKLIESSGKKMSDRKAIVIANSEKFGKIMLAELKKKKIAGEYVLSDELAKNIKKVQSAGVVISAVGQPGLITGEMVKKGAIIIDGGITKRGKKVLGDVDFASVKNKAAYLSPVPGGVGPVTIACLLGNVYLASKRK